MAKTKHMHKRMGQRGITGRIVDIVTRYGEPVGDRVILDTKNIDELLQGMDRLKKDLLRVRDKGGVAVVENLGTQITAFNLNRH